MGKNIVIFSDGTGQDGGARPEQRVSNIYKMYRSARVSFDSATDPAAQVTFYDAGLGTDVGATALTAPVRFVQKLLGSVEGRGILRNIAECYTFIINHYEPGDRIYLFGFSRGAYTVRSVANLLMLCGVPTKTPEGELQRFRSSISDIATEAAETVLEHGAGHPRKEFDAERVELARRFRLKYGADHDSGEENRSNVAPYFIGVFDTVAALGAKGLRRRIIQAGLAFALSSATAIGALVPALALSAVVALIGGPFWMTTILALAVGVICANVWLINKQRSEVTKTIVDFPSKGQSHTHTAIWKGENFDRLLSRFVQYARSANAIDETRADFHRVEWGPTVGGPTATGGIDTFRQIWFAGNHSDIGGSYPETESRLSDISLAWMLKQATEIPSGLEIGPVFINGVKMSGSGDTGQALHLQPDASGVQHCEILAMRDYLDRLPSEFLRSRFRDENYEEAIRPIDSQAVLHPSVYKRFDLANVIQPIGRLPYRPAALKGHAKLAGYYAQEPKA
jgi:uncharacterized protein (DUF2235 family)